MQRSVSRKFREPDGTWRTHSGRRSYLLGGDQGLLDIFQAGIPEKVRKQIGQWQEDGQSVVFYGQETRLLAVLAISDRIKPTSAEAVKELKKQGIEVHLLTGDGVRTAERVAATWISVIIRRK